MPATTTTTTYTQAAAFHALFVEDENIAFQAKADTRRPIFLHFPFERVIHEQYMVINPFKNDAKTRAQEHVASRNGFVIEQDMISLPLQRNWFAATLDRPTISVFSGNKSIHYMISLIESVPATQEESVINMLKKLFPFADYTVLQDSARLCRTPGATRDNGKLQEIEFVGSKWDRDNLFETLQKHTAHLSQVPYLANTNLKKLHSGKIKTQKATRQINDDDRIVLWQELLQDLATCGYSIADGSLEYQALQEQTQYMPQNFDLSAAIIQAKETAETIKKKKATKKTFEHAAISNSVDISTWVKTMLSQMSNNDLLQVVQKYYQPERINERGKNITCCCVFHQDKTPSAYIATHEDGIPKFYCSSCNFAGKDAIDIVRSSKPDISLADACQEVFGRKPPIYCKHCNQEITFQNHIPCETNGTPHQCPKATDICKRCAQEIRWKDKKPFNLDGTPHTHKKQSSASKENTAKTTTIKSEAWFDSKGKIITGIAAEAFIESTKENLIYVKENFYEFVGGVWKIIDDRVIANRIRNMIGTDIAKQTTINDILYQVTIILLEKFVKVILNANGNKLCFQNCVLDLDTYKVEEHSRSYYQTIQLPYEYRPLRKESDAELDEDIKKYAPNWYKFLHSLGFSQATIKRIQEWFGYILIPTTKLERCLFLKGEGSNGKSTLLEVLINLLGQDQVTSLEPQELFDKFKVCMIQDKLANICSDIETSQVFDARFKKLVSGEDQIGEEKQKRPFKFRPYARFIFSANDFIPTRDRSHAFFRRIDVVEFKRIFKEAEQDKDLKAKLRAEIPYIINWALKGLMSLRKNNWTFTESPEFAETKAEFESAVNPVKQFVDEEIQILTPKELAEYKEPPRIACDTFREKYTNWCKSHGYEVMAENKLGRELKRLGIEKQRVREGKKLTYVYLNIQIA